MWCDPGAFLFSLFTWRFLYAFMYVIINKNIYLYLVGGLEHVLFFHSVGNFIIPTEELIIFQRGGSTTNQKSIR